VYKVKVAELSTSVVGVAIHLLDLHQPGTVADITTHPTEIQAELVSTGLRKDSVDHQLMTNQGRKLHIHAPETARGLEFYGVVVVEPAAYPKNLGRFGPLYTSLTRANRELAVVHSESPPDGLRSQGLLSRVSDLT